MRPYKPFKYPWAYEYYKKQRFEMFWNPDEVGLSQDVSQYNNDLKEHEKNFVRDILLFFTQADLDVAGIYTRYHLPKFSLIPEVTMMLLQFASMEAVHIDAYSRLTETLGIDDYAEFSNIPAMKEKHDLDLPRDKLTLPCSVFIEGVQLFGSFVMLLSLVDRGLMPNMGNIVTWSLRDETLHVEGISRLYKEKEHKPRDTDKRTIYAFARKVVELEDRFIDYVYPTVPLPNLSKENLHKYIRFITDYRLSQLGLKPMYYLEKNPIDWLYKFSLTSQEDLFNNSLTAYSKKDMEWDSIW